MTEELKLEHLKLKRHFLSLPLQICNNNRQFQGLKTVLEADGEGSSQHGKNCFQAMRNQVPPETYRFSSSVSVICTMILGSSLEEKSLKELGTTTTVKIEG